MHFDLKPIRFLGNNVVIVCQNENGPCPLIALANILSLQGHIRIPRTNEYIELNNLIELVANYLVEKNMKLEEAHIDSQEKDNVILQRQQQLNEVLSILPSLEHGLNLNVQFTGVSDFEYTKELTVFDALNIPIYHGWVVDPQDKDTAGLIGKLSYNQLLNKLVDYHMEESSNNNNNNTSTTISSPPHYNKSLVNSTSINTNISTNTNAKKSNSDKNEISNKSHKSSSSVLSNTHTHTHNQVDIEMITFSENSSSSSSSLSPKDERVVVVTSGEVEGRGENNCERAGEGDHTPYVIIDSQDYFLNSNTTTTTVINTDNTTDTNKITIDAVNTASKASLPSHPNMTEINTIINPNFIAKDINTDIPDNDNDNIIMKKNETENNIDKDNDREKVVKEVEEEEEDHDLIIVESPSITIIPTTDTKNTMEIQSGQDQLQDHTTTLLHHLDSDNAKNCDSANSDKGNSDKKENNVIMSPTTKRLLIQQFLDMTSSQLTYEGLYQLHHYMKECQLSVFFRNNHFSTLFCYNGQLYVLVTDLGYLHMKDVVWEKLNSIDGNSEYMNDQFERFILDDTDLLVIPPDTDISTYNTHQYHHQPHRYENQSRPPLVPGTRPTVRGTVVSSNNYSTQGVYHEDKTVLRRELKELIRKTENNEAVDGDRLSYLLDTVGLTESDTVVSVTPTTITSTECNSQKRLLISNSLLSSQPDSNHDTDDNEHITGHHTSKMYHNTHENTHHLDDYILAKKLQEIEDLNLAHTLAYTENPNTGTGATAGSQKNGGHLSQRSGQSNRGVQHTGMYSSESRNNRPLGVTTGTTSSSGQNKSSSCDIM